MRGALILLGLVVFVCGWILPGHFPPWPAFQQQWAGAAGVALLGLGAVGDRKTPWHWPLSALALLCLALTPIMQRVAGQILFRSDAVLPALYAVAFALSVAIGANLARAHGESWADRLMTALLVAASVSSGLAIVQWLQLGLAYLPMDRLPPGGKTVRQPRASQPPSHLAGAGSCRHALSLRATPSQRGRRRRALRLVGLGPRDDPIAYRLAVRWHRCVVVDVG